MGRASALVIGIAMSACGGTGADGAGDVGIDAMPECVEGCHWDCFGGSQCVDGVAWVNAFAPRECCHYSDPWPGPGPLCAAHGHACEGGVCSAPDPRYRACVELLGTPGEPCQGADCEHILLWCPEGMPKESGAPCTDDRDCRPAAQGIMRLRCDVGGTNTCVEDVRPAAPDDYGAPCGLGDADVPWLVDGEAVVAPSNGTCELCQVMRIGEGCLQQGCTIPCVYDEDCPAGSVCLCGDWGSPTSGYCAAATDRDTPQGRGAGLSPCP